MNQLLFALILSAAHSDTSIETKAKHELLRQSVVDFNLAAVGFIVSLIVGTIGGVMVLTGQTTEGAVTTATGVGVSAVCAQKKQDAQEKLENLIAGAGSRSSR